MPHYHGYRLLLSFLALTLACIVGADTSWAQTDFPNTFSTLFAVDQSKSLNDGIALSYDKADAYCQLSAQYHAEVAFHLLDFPLSVTQQVDLNLRPFRVMPEGAKVQVMGDGGAIRYIEPQVATFSGYIEDQPGSYAFLAISPNMVNGYFMVDDDQLYILSSGDPKTPEGVATITQANVLFELEPETPWTCQVMNQLVNDLHEGRRFARSLPGSNPVVRIADIFVEGDHQFRGLFSTAQDAADYVVTLFGAGSDVYRRDLGAVLRIPSGYLRIWETVPPWGEVGSGIEDMEAFSDWWRSASNPLRDIDRAAVHLLTTGVWGGRAGAIGGLCTQYTGYEISSVYGFFPVPLQHTHPDNWDPFVLMHELGHTFGSIHTFTYNPPIECNDGSGPDLGTIMGYCHSTYGMGGVGMRFHARVQEVIRNYMEGVNCLEVIEFIMGDYDYNGVIEQSDLDAALMCINLQFDAAGCLETFDLNEDGVLTIDDYNMIYDCNNNGIADFQDLTNGTSQDCNQNGVPDECLNIEYDCNSNGIPDECDIADGTSQDCTGNGIPDECEPDCNQNGIADSCDIASGTSEDVNEDGIPDECSLGTIYVDDNAPDDPFPGIPDNNHPEDGSLEFPYDAIQQAIDVSFFGDVIVVADGVYSGEGNKNLDFGGRPITVRSANGPKNCIIDAEGDGRGFKFHSGETTNSVVQGLTITNGVAPEDPNGYGGGIYCIYSSPMISNCIISNNSAAFGGGIRTIYSDAMILNCTITNNISQVAGGGVACAEDNNLVIRNCVITENVADTGGGIYCVYSSPMISNCTISNNSAIDFLGGGIRNKYSDAMIRNCILWGDAPNEIYYGSSGSPNVSFSDVQGGWQGTGNINDDPLFVDPNPADSDYHLLLGSPCIDTGDPDFVPEPDETDFDGEPRLNGIVDMGSDEYHDCNGNSIPDYQDITAGTSQDCNANSIPDECDINSGTSQDCQPNGIPDECEAGPWFYGDVDDNGAVNTIDLLCLIDGMRGLLTCPNVTFDDVDIFPCGGGDADVNLYDLMALLDTLAGLPPCPDPCP